TTNLEYIYSKLPRDIRSKMVSMKTRTDRTLFFDFLPIEVGEINGMKLRFLLYTVPGQVYYNATRKLVLKGVDAVVFVADSAKGRMQDNIESLENLEENLNDLGITLRRFPWVIQYNKRDLPGCLDPALMESKLNAQNVPSFETVATTGKGVYETFAEVARLVYQNVQENLKEAKSGGETSEKLSEQPISVEIVAKGSSGVRNSEAGKSESLVCAEEREEEHESVSEFVDSVLKEKNHSESSIDLHSTREGYEDYGHVVELNDEEEKGAKTSTEKLEIITDPLEKLANKEPPGLDTQKGDAVLTGINGVEEKVVRIPVLISEEECGKEIPIKLILEVKIEPH
ncbi:MAG: hypothetical protein KAX38_07200, partial [Candidatus Krumholzibacteria bacterium]|nr:hypothetical protein [Candidatus Krumholzibacteria bacterium]